MADIDFNKLSQSELIELKRSLLEYWQSNRSKLQYTKPKEDDYRKTANFEANLARWELNFRENEKLFSDLKTELDKLIRKRSKHLNEPEILANMYEEELKLLPLLEEKGRNVLPDSKRKIHRQIVGRRIEAKGEPNSSIDRFEVEPNTSELKLFQRRFYDSDGKAEQDFDYKHQAPYGTHIFPHIHIWIQGKRSDRILYR